MSLQADHKRKTFASFEK